MYNKHKAYSNNNKVDSVKWQWRRVTSELLSHDALWRLATTERQQMRQAVKVNYARS